MKTFLALLLLSVLILLAACTGGSNPIEVRRQVETISCQGTAFSWTDTGPGPSLAVRAIWTRAPDTSWATLHVMPDSAAPDTILMRRDSSKRWRYDSADWRFTTGWDPDVDERQDSLTVGLGFGFSGVTYELKKE